MAQLIVRNIEDEVAQKLKERAARNGVSAEEEHRRILRVALNESPDKASQGEADATPKMSFEEFLMTMPNVGTDEDFARHKDYMRDIDLSD